MKRLTLLAGIAGIGAMGLAVACGDSGGTGGAGGATSTTGASSTSTTTTSAVTSGSSTSSGMMVPTPPTLGAQIDRMGRPAINTALNHTFDGNMTTKDAAKDAYNADSNTAGWLASNTAEFAKNLAVLDSLDANCGNQLLAGPNAVAGRYDALGSALADDRLWLKTDATNCTTYLAVEANAIGVSNVDCGGRKLDYDVIDESYTVLAMGAFQGIGDGIAADSDTSGTTFPYLAPPH